MADSVGSLGQASVEIVADMSPYDRALADLPNKSRAKIASAMSAIQAQMRKNKFEIQANITSKDTGWFENIQKLNAENDKLAAKMAAVQAAAIKQADSIRTASAAAAQAVATKKAAAQAERELEREMKRSAAAMEKAEAAAVREAQKVIAAINREEAAQARKAAAAEKAAARTAAAAEKAAKAEAVAYDRSVSAYMSKAERMGDASNKAAGGFNNMGMGVLFVSQAIEDAQYGFGAIVNNIPGIVMAFGGSGGLAGGISIAAVGINVLYNNWGKLTNALGMGTVKTAAQEMEELGHKTEKTAEETQKLFEWEERRKNLDAQRGPTEASDALTNDINKAIKESPELNIRRAIDQLHGQQFKNAIPAEIVREREKANNILAFAKIPENNMDVAHYQKRADAANNAYDAAYNANRDKFQSELVSQRDAKGAPAKFLNFIADLEKNNLLDPAARRKLSEAADPSIKKEREFYKEREKRNWESDMRLLKAERESEEEQKKLKEKNQEDEKRRLDADIKSASRGMQETFSQQILGGIVTGNEVSPKDIAPQVADRMAQSGYSQEDINRLATGVAIKTVEDVTQKAQDRATTDDTTLVDAAGAEITDNANKETRDARRRRRGVGGEGGQTSDLAGFASRLQNAVGSKIDPVQAAIKAATERAANAGEATRDAVRTIAKNPKPAVAVGPA